MVDLIGKGYVVQHCISLYRKKIERLRFEMYVSDVLFAINNSIAHAIGGTELTTRYKDLVDPKKEPEETRTGDEIAADIIKGAGLRFADKEDGEDE